MLLIYLKCHIERSRDANETQKHDRNHKKNKE